VAEFSGHLSYLSGLFEENASYEKLNKILEQSSVPTSGGTGRWFIISLSRRSHPGHR